MMLFNACIKKVRKELYLKKLLKKVEGQVIEQKTIPEHYKFNEDINLHPIHYDWMHNRNYNFNSPGIIIDDQLMKIELDSIPISKFNQIER